MRITTKFDYDKVPKGRPFTVRLMVTAEAEVPTGKERRPLNLAVVLDRSGSMGGDKLVNVKEATKILAGQMGKDDVFSLTAFDTQVTPMLAPIRMGGATPSIDSAIDGIQAGDTTNLSGGYEQGCAFARQNKSAENITRVLLLTDGLANVGVQSPAGLADLASRFRAEGITTTTIGVGADYNEELLGKMAETGGGGTYFIENPDEARAVFGEELGVLFSLAANDFDVRFTTAANGLVVEQLNTYPQINNRGWRLGDIYGGQRKHLVLEIKSPAIEHDGNGGVLIGRLNVTYRQVVEAGFEEKTLELPLSIELVSDEEFATVRPDREVSLQAAYLVVAAVKAEVLRMADQQLFEEAARLLEGCANELAALRLQDAVLDSQIQDLRERAHRLRYERENFYNAVERKRMYTEHHVMSKGEQAKYHSMMGRRQGRGSPSHAGAAGAAAAAAAILAREHSYRCYRFDSHILAEIGQERVLIDTGSPSSVGDGGTIRIGNSEYQIAPTFMGTTVTEIGRLIATRISALLGADILNRIDFRIDLDESKFTVTDGTLDFGGTTIPTESFQGVPIIRARFDHGEEKCFFDTGAILSYLHSSLAGSYPVVGTDTDFFPGFGKFQTEVRKSRVKIGGRGYNIRFGTLPPILEAGLLLAGVKGIIGSALCEGNVVGVSGRRNLINVERAGQR